MLETLHQALKLTCSAHYKQTEHTHSYAGGTAGIVYCFVFIFVYGGRDISPVPPTRGSALCVFFVAHAMPN